MLTIPGITLRAAREGDLSQIANLDRLSFAPLSTDSEIEQQWYNGTLDLPNRTVFLAVEDETGLGVGSYAQLDLSTWFEGQEIPLMGIAGVAVAPHWRGKRIARLMLEQALEQGRAQNFPLIALYPFQHGFYRKLGWAWVEQMHQYRVSTRHIPVFESRFNSDRGAPRIVPYDSERHWRSLQTAYSKAAMQKNGWLNRRSWQWNAKLKPAKGREIYCYYEAGELLGYVILQFTHLEPSQSVLAVVVQEWVALTADAYRGILGFLGSLRDQISTVVWNTYPGDPFPHLIKEQRRDPALPSTSFEFGLTHRFGEMGGGFMWRVVDLKRAFELRPINPGEPFALRFQVTDPVFGEQAIAAEFGNSRITCSETPFPAVIKISIEHLTELYCGVRRATDLQWTGELEYGGDPSLLAKLDAAWQASPLFCWDFF